MWNLRQLVYHLCKTNTDLAQETEHWGTPNFPCNDCFSSRDDGLSVTSLKLTIEII